MRKLILVVGLLLLPAWSPVTSKNASSTIAVTNTFQSVQAATPGRNGCLIQNNGTHTMYVYFGPIAGATTGNSYALPGSVGASVSCAVGGLAVLIDQVSITGTSTDAFFANFQ